MDYIAFTPVDFLPWLVIIGFLIPLVFTFVKGKLAYQDTAKENLRSGVWTTAPDYGMDYLASNIAVVIIGAVATVLIPGIVYDMLGAAPTLSGCLAIGLVVAFVVGVKGPKSLSDVVDMFHNTVKIKDLEAMNSEPKN